MKATLSFITAFVMGIIVLNNIQDRENGLTYTAHALAMTHVPDGPLHHRAITDRRYVIGCYSIVVVWEVLIALLSGLGALLLLLNKPFGLTLARWGHLAGCGLFMGAFRGVSGQWFKMWQAGEVNGLPDAHRMLAWFVGVLLFLK